MKNLRMLLITLSFVVLVGAVFRESGFELKAADISTSIRPAVAPTKKTVMSGTTPHEMTGKISEKLQKISKLPDTGLTKMQIPKNFIRHASHKAKSINAFSILGTLRTAGTETRYKVNGIDTSFRADFIRPNKMHVSQSLWDSERGLYVLDEWITLGKDTFVNAGIWGKTQDHETIKRLSGINNSLLPETILSSLDGKKFEHSGRLNVGGDSYIFLQTAIQEVQGAQLQEQIWIDQKTKFIRKYRLAAYEKNTLVGEMIMTFVEDSDKHSISAPEWLNMDSTNTIINTSVCVVEHW